jgi:hypothetical protein
LTSTTEQLFKGKIRHALAPNGHIAPM